MIDINKLQEITEKLNRSKLLKGVAYDVLNTFIEQQKEQLNLHDVDKCVLCKNKTDKPTINYCDECLENYNGIE
ncbi:hypothetical protein H9I45_15070 [Polaribacter haliotis]|uniref:Uncharacterized protein n=1 Tax=Polaribacter haliotis TaxID=1888915 RepID=A0A7L8AFA1_9FLAO|nr:hypothetical protein [Polaribacter haliotis]QOD60640.1 hypothetical protein H9I45_15070 [Polaribacter haliotis]